MLAHRKYLDEWNGLADRVGLESTRQFWDHVATNLGTPPAINSTTVLRGKAGKPKGEGFSRTIHDEISGAGRINYQYCDRYRTTPEGDEHAVVFILTIDLSSH